MSSSLASRYDVEGSKGLTHPIDLGWIGQGTDGVWIKVDPSVPYSERPYLWGIVDQARYGLLELTRSDWDNLSAFEYELAKLCQVTLHNERMRQAKESKS